MPGGNQIRFGIGFDVNRAELNELKKSLLEIQQLSKKDVLSNFGGNEQKAVTALKQAKTAAKELDAILTKTFNSNLGTLNISKFQAELSRLGTSGLNRIYNDLSQIGAQGTNAFNKLATSAMTTNVKLKQTFSVLESMKTTLTNTVRWTIASTAINTLTTSVSKAFNYVKALDASLTDIRIVTGQSRDDMAQFAVQANAAAQALGRQTKEYTNAALTFYQQGLGEAEVQARTEATLKAQNVTGAGTEMADYLTSVWNGFKVSAENTELYVDKLAAVADSSASNMSELAIAMSKVASTANNMGVDMDQLSAQISTIVATTRQAPETVGNALKTIYARINDIKSGSDEAEISLGNYTGKMAELGINVLDTAGRLRDTGDVMEEIGSKWGTMTREQQIYLAQTMAGQRQMNNLIALFDSWQQYTDMLNVSLNAQGSLNEKNARYMDSISAHINQFKAAIEGLQDSLIDEDTVKGVVDAGTGLVNLFNNLIVSMGGMKGASLALGSVLLNTFSSNIANGIIKFSQNLQAAKDNVSLLKEELKVIQTYKNSDVNGTSFQIASWAQQANQFQKTGALSNEQRAELNSNMQQYNNLVGQKNTWEESEAAVLKYANALGRVGKTLNDLGPIMKITVDSAEQLEAVLDKQSQQNENRANRIADLADRYERLQKAQRGLTEQRGIISDDALNKRAQELGQRQSLVFDDFRARYNEFKNIAKSPAAYGLAEDSKIIEELRQKLQQFGNDLKNPMGLNEYASKHIEMYNKVIAAMEGNQARAKAIVQEGASNVANTIDENLAHITTAIEATLKQAALKQQIQGFVSALSGLSGILSGVTSIVNSFKVLSNDTLTTGQKFLQFSQSLAMGVSMLVFNAQRLKAGFTAAKTGLLSFVVAEKLANLETEKNNALQAESNVEKRANIIATYEQSVAETLHSVSLEQVTAALWKQIAAWAVLYKRTLLIIAAIGAFLLIARAVAGALDAQNKAAQEAADRAAELSQNYRDMKQAYEELKASLDDYKDAKQALDGMVTGTEEWREALQKVNDQVLELINKYPELAQYVEKSNGELVLSAKGQTELLRMQQKQVQRAQQISLLASNEARTAQNKVVAQNLARSSYYATKTSDAERIIQAVSENNQILTEWIKLRNGQSHSEDATTAFYEQYLNGEGEMPTWTRAILSNTDKLQESIATIKANTAANEANTDAIMAGVYENNPDYKNSQYQEAINKYSEQALNQAIEGISSDLETVLPSLTSKALFVGSRALVKDVVGVATGISMEVGAAITDTFSTQQKEILDEYAKLQGYEIGSYNKRLDNKIGFVDEQGQSVNIDIEHIIDTVAKNRGLEGLNDPAFQNKLISSVEQLAKVSPELLKFMNGENGDLFNLSMDEIDKLEKKLENNDYSAMFDEFGIVSNKVEKAISEARVAVDNLINDIQSGTVKAAIIAALGEEGDPRRNAISANQTKSLINLASKLYTQTGSVDKFEEFFKQMDTPDELERFFNILEKIDSDTTLASLSKKLSDAGIEVAGFEEILTSLIESLKEDDSFDFETLGKDYKEAKDIVGDLHYGDAITKENLETIRAFAGEEVDSFFKRTAEGEYELIGSAEKLRDIIDQIDTDKLVKRLAAVKTSIDELSKVKNVDLSTPITDTKAYFQIQKRAEAIAAAGGTDTFTVDMAREFAARAKDEDEGNFTNLDLDALNEAASKIEPIKDLLKAAKEEAEGISQALDATKIDEDIDIEDLERMTDYFEKYGGELYKISDDLKDTREISAEVAEAFLRCQAAAEAVAESMEDWKDSFKDPYKDLNKYNKSLEEAENAYRDLLDLSEDVELTPAFIKDAENLALLEDALNNTATSLESYNRLQVKAAMESIDKEHVEDLAVKLDVDASDLMSIIEQRISEIQNSLEPIAIGAELSPSALNALTEFVNMVASSAEDAENILLDTFGVDAQVEEAPPSEANTPVESTQYIPPVYETYPVGGVGFNGAGTFIATRIAKSGAGHFEKVNGTQTSKSMVPFALKVTSANKKKAAGGNITRAKLAGAGGGGKKSSGGGGGGKGGGGGSSKAKDPTKPFKSKIDPYHDINIKIGDTKEGLEKLEKQRDKLIGKTAIENLKKQVDMMEKEKGLLQDKAEIAKAELQRQAQELANLGASFDTNGDILNYKDLLLNKQNQINQAITYGNTLQGDQRDAYDKYIKDLEQEYKDLETAIKEYDDTQQLLDDLELDYADLINEQIEKAAEAFNLEIELHLDLKDAKKEFNEFRKKVIEQIKDDEFGRLAEATARTYQNYYSINEDGTAGGIIPELRQHAQQIKKEIETMTSGGWSNIYGDNLKLAAEDLKKTNDELMQNLEEAQDVIDEVHEHLLSAIDALSDAFDKQQEAFDRVDDFIQHDIELIQLVRGEEDYAALTGLWEQQVATDVQRLNKLRQQQDYWKKQMDQYEEGTDEWKAAMENWQDSFEALNQAMIDSVKNLQSQWENSINAIMKDLRNQAFGGNMTSALEQWEKMEWHSDRYLDDLSRANELLNLQSKYTQAINETDDPKLRRQLTELEEQQLDALSNKKHLREIDLKIAEQQLTVMQAQMALEDAQQSKTKMRLRRDSQGNYTYQYVADEDNIAEKTQEYANALEEYRTMVKESLHEDLQDLSDYTQEFFDKIQEAQMQFGDNAEALQARIAEITEKYTGPEGYITRLVEDANYDQQELQRATFAQAIGLHQNLYDETKNMFGSDDGQITKLINDLLAANGGKIPTLLETFRDDTYNQFLNGITKDTWDQLLDENHGLFHDWNSQIAGIAQQYREKFLPDVAESMYKLQEVHQAYLTGLNIIEGAAGRTFKAVQDGLDGDTGYTKSLKTATNELVAAQKAQVEQAKEVYKTLKDNEQAFKDQTKAAIDAANALYLYWLTLNGQTTGSLPYSFEGYTGVSSNPTSTKASPSSYSNSASSGGSSGSGGSSNSNSNGNSGYTSAAGSRKYDYRGIPWEYSPDNPNRKKGASLSSGGYTGSWGDSSGRLAILHQKELVLNEEDTKNVLNAVNITRAITSGVSSMAAAALGSLSGGRGYSTLESTTDSVLQNVVINADFPAVQDAAQIKQAFNELVNIASQRTSKNRRAY